MVVEILEKAFNAALNFHFIIDEFIEAKNELKQNTLHTSINDKITLYNTPQHLFIDEFELAYFIGNKLKQIELKECARDELQQCSVVVLYCILCREDDITCIRPMSKDNINYDILFLKYCADIIQNDKLLHLPQCIPPKISNLIPLLVTVEVKEDTFESILEITNNAFTTALTYHYVVQMCIRTKKYLKKNSELYKAIKDKVKLYNNYSFDIIYQKVKNDEDAKCWCWSAILYVALCKEKPTETGALEICYNAQFHKYCARMTQNGTFERLGLPKCLSTNVKIYPAN